jgi:glycosyltransferase involved in cell wall biosynthesis
MRIWLVTIGEPVPLGISKGDRLHRTGQFARSLASRGHYVVWWTSTFDHFRKRHHFGGDTTAEVAPRLSIRLLRGCGYSRNISVTRFRDHLQIARKFGIAAAACEVPDVIVAALPTIELCGTCVEYGLRRAVPVVLDMRDMWPDIFVDALPRVIQPAGRVLLSPLYWQAKGACARATAIIGITEEFVDWGLRRGGRQRGPLDRAFPITYEATAPPADKLAAAERFWDDFGVHEDELYLTVCYFGSVGVQLDLTHVVEAARILNRHGCPIRFVLCGRGERLEEYRRRAQGLPNVLLPGWVDGAQIWSLMRRSGAGLDPLPDRYDFLATINNKAVEYLSAGLPVISSPRRGVLCEMLAGESCGLSYSAGSADELAATLQDLQADPIALAGMSARARTVFDRHFAADAVHTRMAGYLAEVVASTGACTAAGAL